MGRHSKQKRQARRALEYGGLKVQQVPWTPPTIDDAKALATRSVDELYAQAAAKGRPEKKLTSESDTIVVVRRVPEKWYTAAKRPRDGQRVVVFPDPHEKQNWERFLTVTREADQRMHSGVSPVEVMEYLNSKSKWTGIDFTAVIGRNTAIELLLQEVLRSGFVGGRGLLDDIYINGTDGVYELEVMLSPDVFRDPMPGEQPPSAHGLPK